LLDIAKNMKFLFAPRACEQEEKNYVTVNVE